MALIQAHFWTKPSCGGCVTQCQCADWSLTFAMFRHVPPKLQSMLGDYDIYGMPLTTWFSPRVNLLVDDSERVQIEGRPFLHAKQVTIEGSSAAMFVNNCFPGLVDTKSNDRILIACHEGYHVNMDQKMLLWNVRDSFGHFSETDEAWIIDKYTQILPFREVPLDTIHVFEAYSGG